MRRLLPPSSPNVPAASTWVRAILTVLLLASAAVPLSAQAGSGGRFALVIGNNEYEGLNPLKNPVNDARDIAAALTRLDFKVDLRLNADLSQMEEGAVLLSQRLSADRNALGLFYYAGHGVQSGGINYLIPSRTAIAAEAFLKTKALSAQSMLDLMQGAGNSLNLVFLDACRDNPFSWKRSGTRGLSILGTQPPGSIIVYATSAGGTADEGTGRNGVFTGELLKHIETPGLDLDTVLNRTAQGVLRVTGNAQNPGVYKQFFETAYLAGSGAPVGVSTAPPNPIAASKFVPAERDLSQSLRGETLIQGGTFRMGSDKGDPNEKPMHSVTVSSFWMMKTEVTVGDFKEFVSNAKHVTTAETSGGGYTWDGKNWVLKPDANWKNPYFAQGDQNPVVLVSWYDAVVYANWLSMKDGLKPSYRISGDNVEWDRNADGWRLPTEAEWEYAARGGKESKGYIYAGKNDPGGVAWYYNNSRGKTQPVGTKTPNELGLFDLSGNVWEWCWDWYGSYSDAEQLDPEGNTSGADRVYRGGGWFAGASYVRSSIRYFITPGIRLNGLGFRLVRSQVR